MDTVPSGGSREVRLKKADYDFAKAAVKPNQLVLCLVDKLFAKEVLMRSTVHGTKDFDALDQKIIAAIKSKLNKLYVKKKYGVKVPFSVMEHFVSEEDSNKFEYSHHFLSAP